VTERPGLTYRAAGVDRAAADRAKDRIGELVQRTFIDGVLSRPGGFGGLFRVPTGYRSPVLVASADGVGTKLKVAMRAGRHDTVGADLVNHCVDDILVEGAAPLFFLDYIGMGRLEEGVVDALVTGVAAGCVANGCALLGGETAEMPDFYAPGEYDLAGFIVGVVEEDGRPGSHQVRAGDALIGIASDGFHTNGYSLLRRLFFETLGMSLDQEVPGTGASLGDVLLRPHRSYATALLPLLRDGRIHALAHITGGGISGNLARVMPDGVAAAVDATSWEVPAEFQFVRDTGRIAGAEMYATFNMGIGMIAIVAQADADAVLADLNGAGERAVIVGRTVPGDGASVEGLA